MHAGDGPRGRVRRFACRFAWPIGEVGAAPPGAQAAAPTVALERRPRLLRGGRAGRAGRVRSIRARLVRMENAAASAGLEQ